MLTPAMAADDVRAYVKIALDQIAYIKERIRETPPGPRPRRLAGGAGRDEGRPQGPPRRPPPPRSSRQERTLAMNASASPQSPPAELLGALKLAKAEWEARARSWSDFRAAYPVTEDEARRLYAAGFTAQQNDRGGLLLSSYRNPNTGAIAFKTLARHGLTTWKAYSSDKKSSAEDGQLSVALKAVTR